MGFLPFSQELEYDKNLSLVAGAYGIFLSQGGLFTQWLLSFKMLWRVEKEIIPVTGANGVGTVYSVLRL